MAATRHHWEHMTGSPITHFIRTFLVSVGVRWIPEKRQGAIAGGLLLIMGVAFTVVWLAFFTGPLEFEERTIAIAAVRPVRGGPTIRVETPEGVAYRLVDDIYRGSRSQEWSRDEVMVVLREMEVAQVWVIPGRLRIQGIQGKGLRLDPSIGYRVEREQRRYGPILAAFCLLLGGFGVWEGRKR